jgi:hypothetical protein
MQNQGNATEKTIRVLGSLSLLVLPLVLAVTFLLHFSTLSEFVDFRFVKPPYSADRLLQTLTGPDGGFRRFTLPHVVGYLTLPLFISASLYMAHVLFNKAPWHALIGAASTCVGVVFMGGVFGAWLSFAAVGRVPVEESSTLLPVLMELTTMQGSLMLSSALSSLTFLGLIILGFGLYFGRIVPRWSAVLFILGNILILAFIDLDNWMFIGALFMLVGLFPLGINGLRPNSGKTTGIQQGGINI